MVKVCHILDSLNIGGLEKIAIDIILNLKGYDHQVWCLKEKGELAAELVAKGIPVREFNFTGGLSIVSISRLVKELKKEHFTAIHCHGLFPSIWARVAAILAGIPVRIVHCHSTYYGLWFKERIKLRWLSYYTTAIITVSEAVKKSLTEYIGISASRITVVYNGLEDIAVQKIDNRDKVRVMLGLAPDDFVICCLGRLVQMKGHRYLIEALSEVRKRQVRCKCLIIGDGPEKQKIEQQVKAMGLDDAVKLLGARRDIPELLSAVDLAVVPSILKEGLPLVLVEASVMSLPLVATDIGGSPEIVKDGLNGFIVEPKDAQALAEKIIYLIEHPGVCREMGQQARGIWQAKFKKTDMLGKIEKIYSSALNNFASKV